MYYKILSGAKQACPRKRRAGGVVSNLTDGSLIADIRLRSKTELRHDKSSKDGLVNSQTICHSGEARSAESGIRLLASSSRLSDTGRSRYDSLSDFVISRLLIGVDGALPNLPDSRQI